MLEGDNNLNFKEVWNTDKNFFSEMMFNGENILISFDDLDLCYWKKYFIKPLTSSLH